MNNWPIISQCTSDTCVHYGQITIIQELAIPFMDYPDPVICFSWLYLGHFLLKNYSTIGQEKEVTDPIKTIICYQLKVNRQAI